MAEPGIRVRESIMAELNARGVAFTHEVHEDTATSADAARIRGTDPREGIKALVLLGKKTGRFFMICAPGDLRVSMKKLGEVTREKLTFAPPEAILQQFDLIIGGVPPFGWLLNIPTYIDQHVGETENVAFNCGLRTESIIMRAEDYRTVAFATWGDFTE